MLRITAVVSSYHSLFIVLPVDIREAIHRKINILEIWLVVGGAVHLLHLYTFMV